MKSIFINCSVECVSNGVQQKKKKNCKLRIQKEISWTIYGPKWKYNGDEFLFKIRPTFGHPMDSFKYHFFLSSRVHVCRVMKYMLRRRYKHALYLFYGLQSIKFDFYDCIKSTPNSPTPTHKPAIGEKRQPDRENGDEWWKCIKMSKFNGKNDNTFKRLSNKLKMNKRSARF